MTAPARWLLLTRPQCHLCEDFEEALRARFPDVELERADVDCREAWSRRFGLKIPVLLDAQGAVVCATQFDAAALTEALAGSGLQRLRTVAGAADAPRNLKPET